jgi:transcriptional regulator with XRE-family HTH domain
MCGPCRQASGIGTDRAPDLGREFWYTDQMRDAFATRDMGVVVRTYRYHPAHGHKPLPQETVSRWLGTVTQSQLSRIESGRNHVDTVDKLVHYAQALRMPADLLWFSLPDVTKDPLPRVDEIIALPDGPLVPAASVSIGSAIADALLKTLEHYVVTDNLAGPRSLVHVAPQQLQFLESLLAGARGKDRTHLLYVGARYAEFVGWIYQDTGSLDTAMQMSNTALDFAEEAEDDALASYILMRKSNIATDAARPELALRLAGSALRGAAKLSPRLRAVVLRQQANAFMQSGDAESCTRALDAAFALADQTPDSETDLAHYCTREYLEMEAAHCWVELGRPSDAVATLQQGLAGWRPEYRRDLGLCLARLSAAHARQEQAEHAVYVAERSLAIARETRSFRVESQLVRIPRLLEAGGASDQARHITSLINVLRSSKES